MKTMFDYFKEAVALIEPEATVELVKEYSGKYKARVIWGGDEMIAEIPTACLPHRHKELALSIARTCFVHILMERGDMVEARAMLDKVVTKEARA